MAAKPRNTHEPTKACLDEEKKTHSQWKCFLTWPFSHPQLSRIVSVPSSSRDSQFVPFLEKDFFSLELFTLLRIKKEAYHTKSEKDYSNSRENLIPQFSFQNSIKCHILHLYCETVCFHRHHIRTEALHRITFSVALSIRIIV